jgi:hypothetical protein
LDTKNSRHESNSYFGSCMAEVKTLVDEIKFKGSITVEIDPEIINIANTYFKLDEIKNLLL